jgi:hypothetical protein
MTEVDHHVAAEQVLDRVAGVDLGGQVQVGGGGYGGAGLGAHAALGAEDPDPDHGSPVRR